MEKDKRDCGEPQECEGATRAAEEARAPEEARRDTFGFLMATAGISLKGMGTDADGNEDSKIRKDTEAQMAQLFQRYLYGDGAAGYAHYGENSVYLFNGRCFEERECQHLHALIKKVMTRSGVAGVYETGSHGFVFKNCILGLECQYPRFERDRRYLVFDNCVLDLENDRQLGFSTDIMTDLDMGFEYRPGFNLPLWDRFIVQTIPSDDMRRAFQMFCGAFLVERDKAKIEFACYLIGPGRNGKSVAANAIGNVFGRRHVSWFSPQQLFSDPTCMYNRAKTDGKLANFSDDVKASDYSGGDFKQFVSGQPFEARNPYGKPYTMKSVPFMVLCVNSMPPTTDDTNGHYRRILPIICPNQIADADVDPELQGKLSTTEARQAIFNWIYEGYRMLKANGWKVSIGQNVIDAQQELMADSNSFRRWLRDMSYQPWDADKGEPGGQWKSRRELMADYTRYCEDMSERPKSMKSVGMILADLGFAKSRKSDGYYYAMKQTGMYGSQLGSEEELPF